MSISIQHTITSDMTPTLLSFCYATTNMSQMSIFYVTHVLSESVETGITVRGL